MTKNTSVQRPLSPHLQVYKPQLTTILSIFHRISGVGLTFALFILVAWIACISHSEEAFLSFQDLFSGFIGKTILLFCLLGFYYHLANGIRHLMWDAGYGFDLTTTYKSGWFVVALTPVLTLLTWIAL